MVDETETPGSYWRVWKAAARLEENGLSSSLHESQRCQAVTQHVISILRKWGHEWGGQTGWQALLNKSSLLHEVEESIVALTSLLEWMEKSSAKVEPVTVVDVCCGKGVFSMLCSYVFQGDNRVGRIVMLDKAPIDWSHIMAANESCEADHRPHIETWERCNLHESDILFDRFNSLPSPLAMIGIHLCKMLSPACIGLVNGLGPAKCPFLCLAPCCLPRAVTSKKESISRTIEIPLYETPDQRQIRLEAMERRDQAIGRGRKLPCPLCHSSSHYVTACDLLPLDHDERTAAIKEVFSSFPCWRCGIVGHFKAECTTIQQSSKPTHVKPPISCMDVSCILEAEKPFEEYCTILTESLQRSEIRVLETGLVNDNAQHQQEKQWNAGRKSIYIIASA